VIQRTERPTIGRPRKDGMVPLQWPFVSLIACPMTSYDTIHAESQTSATRYMANNATWKRWHQTAIITASFPNVDRDFLNIPRRKEWNKGRVSAQIVNKIYSDIMTGTGPVISEILGWQERLINSLAASSITSFYSSTPTHTHTHYSYLVIK
jgi:hypothetical protein